MTRPLRNNQVGKSALRCVVQQHGGTAAKAASNLVPTQAEITSVAAGAVDAALVSALATERATYLTPGAGLPLLVAPTAVTGSGAADSLTLSVPAVVTLTNGNKYRIEGRVTVRKDDGTLLLAQKVEGAELLRSGGAWSEVSPGDIRLLGDAHANVAAYFDAEGKRPALGYSGANLTLEWNAVTAASFVIEFDGTFADSGVSSV